MNSEQRPSSLEERSALTGRRDGGQGPPHGFGPPGSTTTGGPGALVPGGLRPDENDADDDDSPGQSDKDSMEDDPNLIVAQYRTEYRVKSVFKFNLQNVVMFIDGVHYFVKELKSQFEY